MAINKVSLGNQVLIDLTDDTITENDVAKGKKFHRADGKVVYGNFESGTVPVKIVYDYGTVYYVAANNQMATFSGVGEIQTVSPSMLYIPSATVNTGGSGGVSKTNNANIYVVVGEGKVKYVTNPTNGLLYRLSNDETFYRVENPYSAYGREYLNVETIEVAESINDLPVRGIIPTGIWGEPKMKTFICPDSFTNLGPNAFFNCSALETIYFPNNNILYDDPEFQGGLSRIGMYCTALKEIKGNIDTSNITQFPGTFSGCTALERIPMLDMKEATNASDMFSDCTSLYPVHLKNIKTSIDVSNIYNDDYENSYYVTDMIREIINETRKVEDIQNTLTVNSSYYSDDVSNYPDAVHPSDYVKLVEITDSMRTEDPLIDEKMPCEFDASTQLIDPNNYSWELHSGYNNNGENSWAIISNSYFNKGTEDIIAIRPKNGYTYEDLAHCMNSGDGTYTPFWIGLATTNEPYDSTSLPGYELLFEFDGENYQVYDIDIQQAIYNNYIIIGFDYDNYYQGLYTTLQCFELKVGSSEAITLAEYMSMKNWTIQTN